MHRFRHYDGFTTLGEKEKLAHAQQLIEMYSSRLRSGWSPFTDDTQTIYNDHIDYHTVAQIYGTKRSGNRSVRLWVSKFIDTITPGISHSTYLTYKSKLRIFVLWLEHKNLSENDLSTFDSNLIGLFFHYLIDERKLSKVTIDSYAELLTVAFEYFKKEKLILINPVFDIPVCNRINDQAPRPIQREDLDILKGALEKDPELLLAAMFEYYCALRPGHEIRELKIKDIDFLSGTVRVTRTRAKNRVERIVTIPKQLMVQLKDNYKLQTFDREFYVFGVKGRPGTRHIDKNKFGRKFNVIRKKLNMPDEYKFYSFKHTGLIEADENNIPYKDISRHAGHSSPSITDDYFANKKVTTSKAIRDNYPTL